MSHEDLVQGELVLERAAPHGDAGDVLHALHRNEGRDHRHRDHQVGHEGRQCVAAAAGEIAARGARVAGLFGKPPQAGGDEPLVRGRGAPLALAVGVERALEILGPNARRSDLTPGPIGRRRFRHRRDSLPRIECLAVAIQAIEGVAHSEQAGCGDVLVGHADRSSV